MLLSPIGAETSAINAYSFAKSVVIDDKMKIGQWQAIDTKGNVMQEGNLLDDPASEKAVP